MAAKKYETLNVSPQVKAHAKELLEKLAATNEKYPNEMGKPSLNDLIDLALHNFQTELESINGEIEWQENAPRPEVWW